MCRLVGRCAYRTTASLQSEDEDLSNGLPTGHLCGLVLARGGSVAIPLKNVAPLGGRPLLSWALAAMLQWGGFDSVWVSTDHQEIADCAGRHKDVRVFARSAEFARSDSPSISAVQEFLRARPEVDTVGLVQCTSPFIRPEFLEQAYEKLTSEGYDSVFSVTREKKLRWKEVNLQKNTATATATASDFTELHTVPLNFDPAHRPRRQDWAGDLVENGMFYFAKRSLILEQGVFQGGRVTYVEVPNDCSLEIDSPLDLAFASQVLKAKEQDGIDNNVTSASTTVCDYRKPSGSSRLASKQLAQ